MCGASSYHTEESGLIGEIFTGFLKKGQQKREHSTEALKGIMAARTEKQKALAEQEANKAKLIRTMVISFAVIIVIIAIIIAIVMLRKKQQVVK